MSEEQVQATQEASVENNETTVTAQTSNSVDTQTSEESSGASTEASSKNETVSLAKYLEEKNRRKNIEKELGQLKEFKTKEDIKKRWVDKGYDEDDAEDRASMAIRVTQLEQDNKNLLIKSQIEKLTREDDFYSDALNYEREIRSKMEEKGLTAQEAYNVLRGNARRRELLEDSEQKALIKKRTENVQQVIPNAAAVSTNSTYKLDDTDRKALSRLQEMQPEANWNEEKYYKLMKE